MESYWVFWQGGWVGGQEGLRWMGDWCVWWVGGDGGGGGGAGDEG